MPRPEARSAGAYIWTGIALLVLLALNVWLSLLFRGKGWNLAPILVIPAFQAGLVAVFLMSLPKAGRVSWVYVGLAFLLLIIATLSLADYLTRRSPLEESAAGMPAPRQENH